MSRDAPGSLPPHLAGRAAEALRHWGLGPTSIRLLAGRENTIFRVDCAGGPLVLRLHRSNYHDQARLYSELTWMRHLHGAGLKVPLPVAGSDGGLLYTLPANGLFAEQHVDIIGWASGSPLGLQEQALEYAPNRLEHLFGAVGEVVATMHAASDDWNRPSGFRRPDWNLDSLLGENPLWGRFWEAGNLSGEEREALSTIRRGLQTELEAFDKTGLDYGLIHADLTRENLLVDGNEVALIDFDDGGFGYRLYDLAVTLNNVLGEPSFELIRNALLDGYRRKRPLLPSHEDAIPYFMLLRNLSYVAWIDARPDIANAQGLSARFVSQSLRQARALDFL